MKYWPKYHLNFLLGVAFIFILSGCSQISVKQDYDSSIDFKTITKLNWVPAAQQVSPTANEFAIKEPLIAKRIETAIAHEIHAKGLSLNVDTPNAQITYHVYTQTKLRSAPTSSVGFGFGFGSVGRYGGIGFSNTPDIQEYEEGKLVIDILDMNGNLMWRGISNSLLNEQSTPEKTTEFVNEVVAKVFAQFPPQP